MASTAKPPDPMPCALASVLMPESRAHGCHIQNALFLHKPCSWSLGCAVPGAGARRRWSGGVRGPGSGGHWWRALGCTQCLRWQGEGAATSRPALQGFRRSHRQRVGVRGGGSWVGGRMLAWHGWWVSGYPYIGDLSTQFVQPQARKCCRPSPISGASLV